MINIKKTTNHFNLSTILKFLIFAVLVAYTIILTLPLLWALMTSLKSVADFRTNVLGLPVFEKSKTEILKLMNYQYVFKNFKFETVVNYFSGLSLSTHNYEKVSHNLLIILVNTFVYALGGAFIAAIVPAIVGYMCSRYKFKFSKLVYAIVIFVMVMPIVGNVPARITLLRRLSLYDSIAGSLIEKISFTNMYFLVFYAYFSGINKSFYEAAEIDGASQFRVLLTIMLPLAAKMISTITLILFVQYWNDYNTPLLFMPNKPTLAYSIFRLVQQGQGRGDFFFAPAQIAACMMLALPILIIFIIFKNRLMGNISMGGVKE